MKLLRKIGVIARVSTAVCCFNIATMQPASASGIPVFDGASLGQAVQQFVQLQTQYDKLVEQYQELQTHTQKLQTQINAITGSKGLSGLLNGSAETEARRYASTPLRSFLSLATGDGSLSGSAGEVETVAQQFMTDFRFRPGSEIVTADPGSPTAKLIDLRQATALASLSVSETSFDAAPTRLGRIEGLIGAIDSTPDMKASVDLNTRMNGELAILLNEMLMLQALQLRNQGVNANTLAVSEEKSVSIFAFDRTEYDSMLAPSEE